MLDALKDNAQVFKDVVGLYRDLGLGVREVIVSRVAGLVGIDFESEKPARDIFGNQLGSDGEPKAMFER